MKSTRRLSIEKLGDQTTIRYQWCPTMVRYELAVFLAVAVVILVTEHWGHVHGLRDRIEMVWAAMVLALIPVLILNWVEVIVTPEEVRIRCTPVPILSPRRLPRSAIVSVHHWAFVRKVLRYRLAIQTAFPVSLTPLATREEVKLVAEAIAERLGVECIEGPSNRKVDFVYLIDLLRIAGCLAAPLLLLACLHILQM